VLECEIVVAEAGTTFQITETPRGLGGARYWGLAHFCGAAAFATEVALTAGSFPLRKPSRGLIARVGGKGEHVAVANELARSIANNRRERSIDRPLTALFHGRFRAGNRRTDGPAQALSDRGLPRGRQRASRKATNRAVPWTLTQTTGGAVLQRAIRICAEEEFRPIPPAA